MSRAAYSLTTLLRQINARFPYRDRASDGGLGDAAHAARVSDHNPDSTGVYHAYDFDHDPDANGLDCGTLRVELSASNDPRIKYIIFTRRIYYPGGQSNVYTGPNAHTSHLHLSVRGDSIGDDTHLWSLPFLMGGPGGGGGGGGGNGGLSADLCQRVQHVLNAWYPGRFNLAEDGIYGPITEGAVRYLQEHAHITVDGIVGPQTLAVLGLTR